MATPSSYAAGAEPQRSELSEFLDVLRLRGYADAAAGYLEVHKGDQALPADVRDIWDVEMAKSLWAAAGQTRNTQLATQWRESAEKHISAFLKDHPNHPAVAESMEAWGTTDLIRGIQRVELARASAAEPEREIHIKEARELLTQAQKRLTQAMEAYRASGGELTQPPKDDEPTPEEKKDKKSKAAQDLSYHMDETQFHLALVDYWYAQTCTKEQAAEKTARLTSASTMFEGIHRAHNGTNPGWMARYWQTKVLGETAEDMPSIDRALGWCDEVLILLPELVDRKMIGKEIDEFTLKLGCDSTALRLQLLVKKKQPELAVTEGGKWLKDNSSLADLGPYQTLAVEWAKIFVPRLDDVKDPKERSAYLRIAQTTLTRVSRGQGPHQRDASMLLARLAKEQAGKPQGTTFAEVFAAAESAFAAEQWKSAAANYTQALKLLPESKQGVSEKQKQQEHIQDRLIHCQFRLAHGLAREGQFEAAADAAEKLVKDAPKSAIAPAAASLALRALAGLLSDEKDPTRQQALQVRMQTLAENTAKSWPTNPEADEARFLLGRAAVKQSHAVRDQIAELVKKGAGAESEELKKLEAQRQQHTHQAVAMFTSIAATSPRYADAMLSVGYFAWLRYREEVAKPKEKRDASTLKKTSDSALKWLTASLGALPPAAKDAKPDDEREQALRKQRTDLKMLLADVLLACDKKAEAMAAYQELIDAGRAGKADAADDTTKRALRGALFATLNGELDDTKLDMASKLAVEYGQEAGDEKDVNELLYRVLQILKFHLGKAEAEAIKNGIAEKVDEITAEVLAAAEQAADADKKKAAKDLAAARRRTSDLLALLIKRNKQKGNTYIEMVATVIELADTCVRVRMMQDGQKLYTFILAEAGRRPDVATNEKLKDKIIVIRQRLVGMFTKEKNYAEALSQIDVLLKEYPNRLPLVMERATILQGLARTTDPARYGDAAAQWNRVRTQTQVPPRGQTTKLPEHYDAIYNTAECLIRKSQHEQKPNSASIAEQLLNGTLVREPQLNGDENTVNKFKALLKEAAKVQGR